jgi:hypothetical protein
MRTAGHSADVEISGGPVRRWRTVCAATACASLAWLAAVSWVGGCGRTSPGEVATATDASFDSSPPPTDGTVDGPGTDGGADTGVDVGPADTGPCNGCDAPPPCTAATCPSGCCGAGGCEPGTESMACGFGGQTCTDCAAIGLECVAAMGGGTGGACGSLDAGPGPDGQPPCGPATCAGCCAADVCLPGTAADDCGSHGLACEQCNGANVTCAAQSGGGTCVGSGKGCSPMTCAGCCDENGECQDPVVIGACGTGGVACEFCLPSQACNAGQCQTVSGCSPANCLGCCQGTACLSGSIDNDACGSGGAPCQVCMNSTCFPTGAKSGGACMDGEACGGGNCSGCCGPFYQCEPGNTDTFCRDGAEAGSFCGTCGGSCATGTCVGGGFCSVANCSGCCMPDDTCWMGGTDDTHCGDDGQLCVNCGPGYACVPAGGGAVCTIACSPQNCQGCCVDGVCSTGTDPTSCGTGGDVCIQCGAGQSCVSGACLTLTMCGNVLCAGCCDNNDVCHTGTSDSECGTGGSACQDCMTNAQTCKGGVCSP